MLVASRISTFKTSPVEGNDYIKETRELGPTFKSAVVHYCIYWDELCWNAYLHRFCLPLPFNYQSKQALLRTNLGLAPSTSSWTEFNMYTVGSHHVNQSPSVVTSGHRISSGHTHCPFIECRTLAHSRLLSLPINGTTCHGFLTVPVTVCQSDGVTVGWCRLEMVWSIEKRKLISVDCHNTNVEQLLTLHIVKLQQVSTLATTPRSVQASNRDLLVIGFTVGTWNPNSNLASWESEIPIPVSHPLQQFFLYFFH